MVFFFSPVPVLNEFRFSGQNSYNLNSMHLAVNEDRLHCISDHLNVLHLFFV